MVGETPPGGLFSRFWWLDRPGFGGLTVPRTIVDDRMADLMLFRLLVGETPPGDLFSRFWWLDRSTYNRR